MEGTMESTPNSSGTAARHPLVSQLLDLGIEESVAIAACEATAFSSVDAAMAVMFDNDDDNKNSRTRGIGDGDENDPPSRRYKLTVAVRQDLGMSPGKMAAQTCHAVLAAYRTAVARAPDAVRAWEAQGEPVVVLRLENLKALDRVANAAGAEGLTASTVCDAGRTEVVAGSVTCCAVGPGPVDAVDRVTGSLRLL